MLLTPFRVIPRTLAEWNRWIREQKLRQGVETVTETTHQAANKSYILVDDDSAGGAVTVNLPAAKSALEEYCIKKLGSTGNVTVDANGSETIDGASTYSLTIQNQSVSIITDRSNWFIV